MDFAALIIPSFIAGLLTFLAPCTLPLVPGYLAFISGVSPGDLDQKDHSKKVRRRVMLNGIFYVVGFSLVFILLGSLFGLGGAALLQYRIWLSRIGGIFVILFGIFLIFGSNMKWLSFMNTEKRFHASKILKPGNPGSSLIFGATFAFGWTPCVGPILGSVLLLASSSATLSQGAFLLFIFSMGLAIPFLILAGTIGSAMHYMKRMNKYLGIISKVGGVFLLIVGVLLVFDMQQLLNGSLYRMLTVINYNTLLDYL